jgi:hypothetical protein
LVCRPPKLSQPEEDQAGERHDGDFAADQNPIDAAFRDTNG